MRVKVQSGHLGVGHFTPGAYFSSCHSTVTRSPVRVFVPRRQANMTSQQRKGMPAQLLPMGPKSRCSTGFHLLAPLG